ncbi:hypothetical protein [Rhizobium phaseoli]|uniref:hypothetical protein n=1 Tax=Rhizobium phaseoli TaxID=396 RepID=UPI000BE8205C|nr:hypothetical protein [Rhizobium phaseoli]PDS69646.1 hypothetical protein CO651_23030 [Rhizobium phaseoli]
MSGWSLKDVYLIAHQEQELLDQLSEAQWNTDEASAIIEDYMPDGSEVVWFDPGVAGASFALSAAGATPISSCNGGTIGQGSHSSDTPNILLVAGHRMDDAGVGDSLLLAEVGIVPNGEFAEIFTEDILKFHKFAVQLLNELDGYIRPWTAKDLPLEYVRFILNHSLHV